MKKFLDKDFLLNSETAVRLYREYAEKQPIIDYHCHIDPKEIYEDKRFYNITQLWLAGDHYKWRIMRSNGVPERFITGDASDREKFQKFAEALPRCIGNPMYHWCHLEFKNYFGYNGVLSGETAEEVWQLTSEKMAGGAISAKQLIADSNVEMICTTDDPCSDLRYHKLLRESSYEVAVYPGFRPDGAVNITKPSFADYIKRLAEASGTAINSVSELLSALSARIEYFASNGCKISDHGLDYVMFREADDTAIDAAFAKAMRGDTLTREEAEAYQTRVLLHCAEEYKNHGWVMQLHFSCMRNPNSSRFAELGADSGFDCIAVTDSCASLYALLDAAHTRNALPKTILYSLNPADNQWIDTLLGAFQDSGVRGSIQHGAAWWFNDNKLGMIEHMQSLANLGILGNFVGMLTDSRSFLSYSRHEYFRRILCDLIGGWVENGEYPNDITTLGGLVSDICHDNAKIYFEL